MLTVPPWVSWGCGKSRVNYLKPPEPRELGRDIFHEPSHFLAHPVFGLQPGAEIQHHHPAFPRPGEILDDGDGVSAHHGRGGARGMTAWRANRVALGGVII